ncbi:MAG: vitamin B12-dependent ribonucleotide reductase [bacterium]
MDTKKLIDPVLSENARTVLNRRYFGKDENGNAAEDAKGMFFRVAKNIASADLLYDKKADLDKTILEFYDLMANLEFLPNSPTLMNAGRDMQQLAACFVLPIEDSIEDIFNAVKYAALIHKSGGGTGFSFSKLRPNRDKVKTTNGVSSGPVSFMKVFNAATEAIKQGGTRRGANMGILRVDHPDVREFITCKTDNADITNFNISVAITERFMQAVKNGSKYDLINPRDGKVFGQEDAREIFEMIVDNSWKNGDPGIIFIDAINKDNPTPHIGAIESTNPCGEQPLLPYEACNLGSINLAIMITKDKKVDYQRIKEVTHKAVHFLDNVIDMSRYPLDLIDKMVRANRKIGLGIMGWADMLIELGLSYNSVQATKLAEEVMAFIHAEARNASTKLAEKRGVFPNFKGSVYDGKLKLRNATLTTIAPTGTLSIIGDCSSGIEPLFAVAFTKNVMDNDKLPEVNQIFLRMAKEGGFYSDDMLKEVGKTGHLHNAKGVPENIKKIFVTAHDIAPEWHINMQAAFQKATDNAVSKTVNFNSDATKEDVKKVYMMAYDTGCKGVTIYRDGSKEGQVLTVGDKKSSGTVVQTALTASHDLEPRKRPAVTFGKTIKMKTGCGNLYVTINEDENGLCEVFTAMGKSGGCAAAQSESVSRLVSVALRAGVKQDIIVKHLRGIRCPAPAWQEGGIVLSCPDAIGIALEKYMHEKKDTNEKFIFKLDEGRQFTGEMCPECGATLEHEGGCNVCKICGYSKCL